MGHPELVDRVLARRAPFTTAEKGYRDALLWYTALDLASASDVLLLTANTKDFSDGEGQLHPDLVADLESRKLAADRVRLLTTTNAVLGRCLPPQWSDGETRAALESLFRTDSFREHVNEELAARGGLVFDPVPVDLAPNMWSIAMLDIVDINAIVSTLVPPDSDGCQVVSCSLDANVHIGGIAWWRAAIADDSWVLWSELTEYFSLLRSERERGVRLEIAASFCPPHDLKSLDCVDVSLLDQPVGSTESAIAREARCMASELDALIEDATSDSDRYHELVDSYEYVSAFAQALSALEPALAHLGRNFPALSPENLERTVHEVAGLRAIRGELADALQEFER